jgi:hypothetical protein
MIFDVRHDCVLLFNHPWHEIIVLWDPLTGYHRTLVILLLVDDEEMII